MNKKQKLLKHRFDRKSHAQSTSDLLINLSSGFFGLVLLSPLSSLETGVVIRNLFFGFVFYLFAVKIKSI